MRVQRLYDNLLVASVYFLFSELSVYGNLGVNCFCGAVLACFRI
jgi:hypothetical protein